MRSDVPRSPCSALPMNAMYCLSSEPSRPSAVIRRARSSPVASSGSIRSTGLPVSRPRKNTTVATSTSSTRPCNSRRAMKPPISEYPQKQLHRFADRHIAHCRQSLLPRLLVGMRNAFEHVSKFVPTRDGSEFADPFCVDRIIAHPLDDRHDHPFFGNELHHAVIQCGPLGRIALVDHRLIDIDELRAGPLAVVLVAEHPLGAVWREGGVVTPGRVRPAGRSEHRRPAR